MQKIGDVINWDYVNPVNPNPARVEGKLMKVLIAEDDLTSRTILELCLEKEGYEFVVVDNGLDAWNLMKEADHPSIAILDWMMPGLTGLEVCRRIRECASDNQPYLILLTVRDEREDLLTGLDSGADDYITKPFDSEELSARLKVGERIHGLQASLNQRVRELQEALGQIRALQGVLPICSYCHKIRDDQEVWFKLEQYIQEHSMARLSHSLCPECQARYYPETVAKSVDD